MATFAFNVRFQRCSSNASRIGISLLGVHFVCLVNCLVGNIGEVYVALLCNLDHVIILIGILAILVSEQTRGKSFSTTSIFRSNFTTLQKNTSLVIPQRISHPDATDIRTTATAYILEKIRSLTMRFLSFTQ